MNHKLLLNWLKIAVSLVAIAFILWTIDLARLSKTFLSADWRWLVLALILVLLNIPLRAKRWQILLAAIGVNVPLKELTVIYFIGAAFNNLLPSAVGGDAIRAVELNHYTHRVSDAITSVFVDRFLGLYGSLLLGFVTLIFAWQRVPVIVSVVSVIFFLGLTGLGFVLIYAPLYRLLCHIFLFRRITAIAFVDNLFQSFQQYQLAALRQAFLIGLLVNGLLIAINVAIGIGLGMTISFVYYLIFVPLVNLILAVPISFAGFGTREPTYMALFSQVGVASETALALSLLVYVFGNIVTGLIGGAVYLWRSARGLQLERRT